MAKIPRMSKGEQGVKNQFKGTNLLKSPEPLKQLCTVALLDGTQELASFHLHHNSPICVDTICSEACTFGVREPPPYITASPCTICSAFRDACLQNWCIIWKTKWKFKALSVWTDFYCFALSILEWLNIKFELSFWYSGVLKTGESQEKNS